MTAEKADNAEQIKQVMGIYDKRTHVAVPLDNDFALMALITNWPVEKRRRFYAAVKLFLEDD